MQQNQHYDTIKAYLEAVQQRWPHAMVVTRDGEITLAAALILLEKQCVAEGQHHQP